METEPTVAIIGAVVLGLVAGSFLNMLVHRLPIMLVRRWREECVEATAGGGAEPAGEPPFNLAVPGSHCPRCERPLGIAENIPLLGYLLQRGRCRGCHAAIPPRYPLLEIACAGVAVAAVALLGLSVHAVVVALAGWTLLALAVIDLEHMLLPDTLTLPLLWAGLLWAATSPHGPSAEAAVVGAAAGYLSLRAVGETFLWGTGRDGIGHGDYKLTAALGAWLGWTALPALVLVAAVGGLIAALAPVLAGRPPSRKIPFGPFLAAAGWLLLLAPAPFTGWYL